MPIQGKEREEGRGWQRDGGQGERRVQGGERELVVASGGYTQSWFRKSFKLVEYFGDS